MSKSSKLLAALLLLPLAGCVGELLQSKSAEPQVYVLRASPVAASVAYPVQLSIGLPSTAPGLDSDRIAVLRNDNQLDYYYGARWSGSAARVVQSFLLTLLESQQGLRSVVPDNSRIDTDYLLELQLRDFQAEYTSTGNPTVKVTLSGTLLHIKSRRAVHTLQASATISANDNRLSAVVAAFQSATQQVSASISTQLMTGLQQQL